MKVQLDPAGKIAIQCVLFVGALVVGAGGVDASQKPTHRIAGNIYNYGSNGPNLSYQAGPHTRIYVSKRSWLDAGTEVLPGDRKFTDYALPPGYSFARENNTHPLDRQPLNPPSDMGGYLMKIPLN